MIYIMFCYCPLTGMAGIKDEIEKRSSFQKQVQADRLVSLSLSLSLSVCLSLSLSLSLSLTHTHTHTHTHTYTLYLLFFSSLPNPPTHPPPSPLRPNYYLN